MMRFSFGIDNVVCFSISLKSNFGSLGIFFYSLKLNREGDLPCLKL